MRDLPFLSFDLGLDDIVGDHYLLLAKLSSGGGQNVYLLVPSNAGLRWYPKRIYFILQLGIRVSQIILGM